MRAALSWASCMQQSFRRDMKGIVLREKISAWM